MDLKLILLLSVSKAAYHVTRWVHEKITKKSKATHFGHEKGSIIARFVISHKTWSKRTPMQMTALNRKSFNNLWRHPVSDS